MLPGVRFACDAYVELVRERSLLEAVASSLTEFFAPDLMSARIAAWEKHYPWVKPELLEYFRSRVPRARRDSEEAIEFVAANARTYEMQERCVAALLRKTEILWHLLDCVEAATAAGSGRRRVISAASRPQLAAKARLRRDRRTDRLMILYPEKGIELSSTAAEIVRLCTGENTVAEIVERLGASYATADRATIEREVLDLLNALADRCLIEERS